MLTIYDGKHRLSRRQLLTIGSLGLGGLTLPSLMARAGEPKSHISGKSVIFLFQQGGPSQLETFDPKMDAPNAVRTMTGSTQTKVPGVVFGDTMSRLSTLADKLAVVRSFQTGNAGHNIRPIVGPESREANIGVHYSRLVGSTRAATGMPTNAVLYPNAVDPEVPGPEARGDLRATGSYSSAYVPFVPGAGGKLQDHMELHLQKGRFLQRRELLAGLDTLKREMDANGQLETEHALKQQAYQVLLGGGVSKALDLSLEDPKTLAHYDTSRFARQGQWNHVSRGKRGYYTSQAKTMGHLLLLARRLCEAGCGFITIHAGYAGVWDMHADGNNLNMVDGMKAVGQSFDHAVAAFIEDVEARGLRDKIMLVTTGEMGRTPKINKRGGRDHWSRLAPLLLYGGDVRGGQVIGQSTRDGGEPATEAMTTQHLISTIMHTVFDVGRLRLLSGIPDQITQLSQNQPIPVFD